MKKHVIVLFFAFFLCAATTHAQQSLTLQGRVIDTTNAQTKGIPYVNIGFPATSVGTASNELGDFVIKIPTERRADTLVFSSIGYVTFKIAVKDIKQKTLKNIVLKPNTINLDEFVFKVLDANKTLATFFKNRDKNYANKPALLQFFCREALKATRNDTYYAQSEGILEMYKSPVNETDDHVRLVKGRKKKLNNTYVNEDERTLKIPDIVDAPTTGILLDIVKSKTFFIEQSKQFTFTHNGYERLNDRLAYVLDFSPKDTSRRLLKPEEHDFYSGKIYIDTATFALVRAEFDLSKRGRNVVNMELDMGKLPLRIKKRTYVVDYAEYNNKWYFKSANVVNNYTLDHELELTNRLEAFVTSIKTEKVKKFPSSQDINEQESLGNQIEHFDDSFWEDYNFIKSTQAEDNNPETDKPTLPKLDTLAAPKKDTIVPLKIERQSNKQVNFSDISLKDAQKLAAKQERFVFVDVYATWCKPCKQMAAEAFKDAEISELMNTFFVNLQVDGEAGGRSIASKYNVQGYPTTLIINPQGVLIAKNEGYAGVGNFLIQMEAAADLTSTGHLYLEVQKAYFEHKKDINYILAYAISKRRLGIPTESLTDRVVKNLPLDSLKAIHFQQFITNFATEPDGKTFDFILTHRDFLLFENKLTLLIRNNFDVAVAKKDKNLLKRVLKANEKIINDPSVSAEKNKQLTLKFDEVTKN